MSEMHFVGVEYFLWEQPPCRLCQRGVFKRFSSAIDVPGAARAPEATPLTSSASTMILLVATVAGRSVTNKNDGTYVARRGVEHVKNMAALRASRQ